MEACNWTKNSALLFAIAALAFTGGIRSLPKTWPQKPLQDLMAAAEAVRGGGGGHRGACEARSSQALANATTCKMMLAPPTHTCASMSWLCCSEVTTGEDDPRTRFECGSGASDTGEKASPQWSEHNSISGNAASTAKTRCPKCSKAASSCTGSAQTNTACQSSNDENSTSTCRSNTVSGFQSSDMTPNEVVAPFNANENSKEEANRPLQEDSPLPLTNERLTSCGCHSPTIIDVNGSCAQRKRPSFNTVEPSVSAFASDVSELVAFLCRRSSVFSLQHLLAKGHDADVAAFSTALTLQRATIGELVESGPRNTSRPLFSCVYVPSHSITEPTEDGFSLTLGSCVYSAAETMEQLSVLGRGAMGRYVHDNATHEQIELCYRVEDRAASADSSSSSLSSPSDDSHSRGLSPAKATCVLVYSRATSTVGFRHVYATMNAATVTEVLQSRNAERILSAIEVCTTRYLVHNCILCGKPPGVLCGCELPTRIPTHPHDVPPPPSAASSDKSVLYGHMWTRFNPLLSAAKIREWQLQWRGAGAKGHRSRSPAWRDVMGRMSTTKANPIRVQDLVRMGLSICAQDQGIPRQVVQNNAVAPLVSASFLTERQQSSPASLPAPYKHISKVARNQTPIREPAQHNKPTINTVQQKTTPLPVVSQERKEMLRKRRERNRLAAARSNARRKAENDERKRLVALSKNHVCTLEEKRDMLTEENARLKLRLVDTTVTGGTTRATSSVGHS